jgi:hypothetical protein
VLIFSVAGFPRLQPEGQDTDRTIASMMVTELAGYYEDLGTHNRGPKDCPFWFNQKREFKHLVGPQKFCRACLGKLRARRSGRLAALDALLKVFSPPRRSG